MVHYQALSSEKETSESVETIAAIATPPGRGGIGIIRVSGPLCLEIARAMLGFLPKPRTAQFADFIDSQSHVLDQGVVLYFPSPHSFTGEDVLELQGHGSPVVLDSLLTCILNLGARLARPGEFSERAFLNGKIDLTQAEAIADLIHSDSHQAARAAMQSLQGAFSKAIYHLVDQLIQLRMFIEAAIDFPEEEINFLQDGRIETNLQTVIEALNTIFALAEQGSLLQEGMTIVIAGSPNAGKSSLLNQFVGKQTAIVTDIPGTTRDVLREYIHIDGLPLHIVDTAGLHSSGDIVEQEGMRRALLEIERADQILWVIDSQTHSTDQLSDVLLQIKQVTGMSIEPKKLMVIQNKIDLTNESPGVFCQEGCTKIKVSAKTGEGISDLNSYLKKIMGFNSGIEGKFIARRRHLDALKRAVVCLENGLKQFQLQHAGELLAEDLRQAQQALDEITGRFTSDDLLGKIFSSFCIGK